MTQPNVGIVPDRKAELLARVSGGKGIPAPAAPSQPPPGTVTDAAELTQKTQLVPPTLRTPSGALFNLPVPPSNDALPPAIPIPKPPSAPLQAPPVTPFQQLTAEQQMTVQQAVKTVETTEPAFYQTAVPTTIAPPGPITDVVMNLSPKKRNVTVPQAAPVAPSPTSQPESPPAPEAPPATNFAPEQHTHCQRCGFPAGQPDDVEVTADDRMVYKAAFLMGTPFFKEYRLLDGSLGLTFRELTPGELDACWAQVGYDVKSGVFSPDASTEMLSRYRLSLQLLSATASIANGINLVAPEGLSPITNPGASSHWLSDDDMRALEGFDKGNRGLSRILASIEQHSLRTESLFRVVFVALRNFNRLVAKLEVLVQDPNFTKRTGR